jgi:hypothetical protein
MTEAEWNSCTDPEKMLESLEGWVSQRKLQLFAVACGRRLWHILEDERSRQGVEVAERFADGLVTEADCDKANGLAWWGHGDSYGPLVDYLRDTPESQRKPSHLDSLMAATCAAEAAAWVGTREVGWMQVDDDSVAARLLAGRALAPARRAVNGRRAGSTQAEKRAQCQLLRDIVGYPLSPTSFDPAWVTPTVWHLARGVYDERQLPAGTLEPARLAVLADALEEAGCDNETILAHCRGPGPHVRGCWVLDLVRGTG